MIKRRKRLISKLLFLAVCTSFVQTTIVFQGERASAKEKVPNTLQLASKTATVANEKEVDKASIESDFTFDEKTGTIKQYKGTDTEVVIPSIINGVPVTRISSDSFSSCTTVTSVTVPSSVTDINNNAFGDCPSLKKIIVDENNKNFVGVDGVLFNKSQTEIVQYPEGKEDESYVIPSSVTSTRYFAFSNCKNIKSINLPNSLTNLEIYPFQDCSNLKDIIVDENNKDYSSIDGILFDKSQTAILKYPEGKEGESYVIPGSVDSIGGWTFYNCKSLKNVKIPNGLTYIGVYAFNGCSNLESAEIPSSVSDLGYAAFSECKSLKSATIPDGIYKIEPNLFCDCESLTSISIPNSVTDIGYDAFFRCKGLTNVTLPKNLRSIDNGVFGDCRNLTSINLPDSLSSIGEQAFYFCSNLTSIEIPNGLTKIGDEAFTNCNSLKKVVIPHTVTSIGDRAFKDNDGEVFYVDSTAVWERLIEMGIDAFDIKLSQQVDTIILNSEKLNILTGDKATLTATMSPNDGTKKVVWESDNKDVATIDENGLITAKAPGAANIKCTATDGSEKFATCQVIVGSCTNSNEEKVKIALNSNGSTGYEWQYVNLDNNSDVIKEISKDYSVDIPDPPPGHGETTIWTFQGLKEGSTIVKFKYLQPWMGKAIDSKIFKFTVDKDLKVTVKELYSNEFLGDVNCDGEINIADCILLKKYLADNSIKINKENADVDENSKIDLNDYNKLTKLI